MKVKNVLPVVLSVLLAAFLVSSLVSAAAPYADVPIFDIGIFYKLAIGVLQSAGIGGLLALIVSIGKYFGIVKDGYAGKTFGVLVIAAIVGVFATYIFAPNIQLAWIDSQAVSLTGFVGLLFALATGQYTYDQMKSLDIPALGASHTNGTTLTFLASERKGQGLVEYALILVLVAVVVIATLAILGPQIGNMFNDISNSLSGL
jgi:pilus assembly protein Flp/PilA